MTTPTREELLKLANAASKDGEHIYSNPRDHHNWKANETWHRAASPEAFIALLSAHQAQGEPVVRIEFVDRGVSPGLHIRKWDCLTDLPAGTYDLYLASPPSSAQTDQGWNEAVGDSNE